jgi:5-methylcytosine-specific restriction enzyme A
MSPSLRVRDLPRPVVAARAAWVVASHWMGFTPRDGTLNARARTMSTVAAQAGDGYVLEYITLNHLRPNVGFEGDAGYRADRARHAAVAGRLVGVHRLRPTARDLREIMGEAEYDHFQDAWAEGAERHRWSVAFPIVESFAVVEPPLAEVVFGPVAVRRLFGHPSATLRPLNAEERKALADLHIDHRHTESAWIGIEDDAAKAAMSEVPGRLRRDIEADLARVAVEGLTEERRAKVYQRAAWLANCFATERERGGRLRCDECGFDAIAKANGTKVRPRSLLDVHHKSPLAEGVRCTSFLDLSLLCPTCHRYTHELLRLRRREKA